ncbi:hypothetical protein PQR05_29370 [Paraburkholderia sediminicola]|uniref:hypothetical protein n=1 Tax=Paraburkholderia sediminicola TaxID=458836 RepID=UPI0038B7DF1A
MTKTQLKKRLNEIAELVNHLDDDLKAQFGEQAFVFFEADGNIHAMKGDADPDRGSMRERQKFIVASSGQSAHAVGAW